PLPLVGSAAACCAWLAGECWAQAPRLQAVWLPGCCMGRPRTGWSRCWLQAGRSSRFSTCPAGGFQPARLEGCSRSSSSSHGYWPLTAELTWVVRCHSTSTTLPRSWSVPLGLHTTFQQARNTASAPQPPLVPIAAPKNTTSCLEGPWRSMDTSAISSSNCLKNCSSARSWALYSLSRCRAHLGSRYTFHTASQVARVTVMRFRLAIREVPAELAVARCWRW
ncbi:hypothetical protein V8C86DRAFT_2575184, partial [Haematococcus lacustris]